MNHVPGSKLRIASDHLESRLEPISILPHNLTCGPYQPIAAGVELYPETGDRQSSLANLRRLIEAGERRVRDCFSIEGSVLVLFDTGEVYFALGFDGSSEYEEFLGEYIGVDLGMKWTLENE